MVRNPSYSVRLNIQEVLPNTRVIFLPITIKCCGRREEFP